MAITTRWRSPPEKLWGQRPQRSSGRSMPTSSSSSSTRRRTAWRESLGWWTRTASAICFPMGMVGVRAVMGSWSTMENSRPRRRSISRWPKAVMSVSSARTVPPLIHASRGSSFMMDLHSTLFPQPDSPTTASTSPARTEKDTSRTASSSPWGVRKLTDRFFTSNRSDMGASFG